MLPEAVLTRKQLRRLAVPACARTGTTDSCCRVKAGHHSKSKPSNHKLNTEIYSRGATGRSLQRGTGNLAYFRTRTTISFKLHVVIREAKKFGHTHANGVWKSKEMAKFSSSTVRLGNEVTSPGFCGKCLLPLSYLTGCRPEEFSRLKPCTANHLN